MTCYVTNQINQHMAERESDLELEALRDKCDALENDRDAAVDANKRYHSEMFRLQAERDRLQSTVAALERERDELKHLNAVLTPEQAVINLINSRATLRDLLNQTVASRDEGLKIEDNLRTVLDELCNAAEDRLTRTARSVADSLGQRRRLEAAVIDSRAALAALAEPTRDLQAEVQRDQRESPDINSATSL